jgi:hypothetical protein
MTGSEAILGAVLALAQYYRAVWGRAWGLMAADLRSSVQVTIATVVLALLGPTFVEALLRLHLLVGEHTRLAEFGQAVHDGAITSVAVLLIYVAILSVSSFTRAPASLHSELAGQVRDLEALIATKVDPAPLALSDEVQQLIHNEVAAQVQHAVSQFPATAQAIEGGATTDPPLQAEQGAHHEDPPAQQ